MVRICLCGNHDQAFLDFLNQPSMAHEWLEFGGKETLSSYGIDMEHISRMKLKRQDFGSLLHQSVPP